MTTENHQIARYQHEYVSEVVNGVTRALNYVFLYGMDKKLLCAIACVPGKSSLAAAQISPNGHITLELPESQMAGIVDLLRNEKPAYFSWNPTTQTVRVSTNMEPVGEEEVRKMFSFLYL